MVGDRVEKEVNGLMAMMEELSKDTRLRLNVTRANSPKPLKMRVHLLTLVMNMLEFKEDVIKIFRKRSVVQDVDRECTRSAGSRIRING